MLEMPSECLSSIKWSLINRELTIARICRVLHMYR